MKKPYFKIYIIALLLFTGFTACELNTTQESVVTPILTQADTPMSTHIVEASKGGVITIASGSTINIPENAFVDADGTPITGKVEIEYREFHDAGSVLASGIPMEYTEDGITHSFQTAGMFEIRGYASGVNTMQLAGAAADTRQPVFVAPDKILSTNIASFTNDEGYNFYFFNEKTKQWEYRQTSIAEINEKKKKALDIVAPMPDKPQKPEPFNKNNPVFDLEVNLKDFPELKEFKGVLWQYAGKAEADDPNSPENKWVGKVNWTTINLESTEEEGVFEVVFNSATEQKTFVTYLKPVLRGKNYDKAMAKFNKKLEGYKEAKSKRIAEEDQRSTEGSFLRSAGINGFGIYNHDIFYNMDNMVSCNATFSLSNGERLNQTVFMLAGANTALIKYECTNCTDFQFPKNDAVLVAVMDDNQLAVLSNKELSSMEIDEDGINNFELKVIGGVVTTEELASTISSLW